MNTQVNMNTDVSKRPVRWTFWVVNLGLFAGFILSILSWMELCVEHCSANQAYLLFGMPFAIVGMSFFATALILSLLSGKYEFLSKILSWMIAAALGSELMFIGVQKYQIGHWCPVCLSIAFTLLIVGWALSVNYFKNLFLSFHSHHRGQIMSIIKQGFTSFLWLTVGFVMAFLGVTKPDYAQAAMNDIKDKIAFGQKDNPVEIYFVSDWFCPSCKKVEPLIERIYPKIQSKATFYFVDYPIHKNSLNFVPYNLAFMINNKPQYFKARRGLLDLASDNETPTDEDVIEYSQAHHLAFRELSFVDVKAGMEWFDQIVDKYNLKATPVIIITNTQNHKTVKLEGTDEISESSILKGIETVKPHQ